MSKLICDTCEKRKDCRFRNELTAAMNSLTALVSKAARAQIQEVVAKDITCGSYRKEES